MTPSTSTDIIPAPDARQDPEWQEIVDQLVEEMGDELPDQVIRATELLMCGWPTYQAAKQIGTSAKTIKTWLEKYPAMANAVRKGREMLTTWRMSKLEQQFALAAAKSQDILNLSPADKSVDARLTGVIAQHARFVMSLFLGQKVDVNIHLPETPQMKARNDALDYIAKQMGREEVIEGTCVIEPARNKQPLLNEDGKPYHGQLGILDVNADGMLCHICGDRTRHPQHIAGHGISISEYCLVFMVNEDALKTLSLISDAPVN